MRGRPALVLGLAALSAACVSDPYREPVPGRAAHAVLMPGTAPTRARWPVSYRRGAEFVIENRTGASVETLIFDLSGEGRPRELVEAVITEPPGRTAVLLPAPHPDWVLRARLGDPGSVLLEPGESLTLLVRVTGSAGRSVAKITIPGVSEE